MDKYFEELAADLYFTASESFSELEKVAQEEFGIDPYDYETVDQIIQACVAVEQYTAFS